MFVTRIIEEKLLVRHGKYIVQNVYSIYSSIASDDVEALPQTKVVDSHLCMKPLQLREVSRSEV